MADVLIVDDHPLYLNGISALLKLHLEDARIFGAGNAREAVTLVGEHNTIGLVFIDYHLPDTNGIELLQSLRTRIPRARFVLTSGNDRIELVSDALDQGAHGFLSKSGAPSEVMACLGKILAGDIYLSPQMQLQLRHHRATVRKKNKRAIHQISKRQKEVLLLLSAGYSNAEIASALGISPHTVKDHVSNIMQLLDADNRVHCIIEARQLGLIN